MSERSIGHADTRNRNHEPARTSCASLRQDCPGRIALSVQRLADQRCAPRERAHSIVAVMLLAAAVGTTIRVETDGPDEMAAMNAMVSLLNDGLEQPSIAGRHARRDVRAW